jgi:hypothetical protein
LDCHVVSTNYSRLEPDAVRLGYDVVGLGSSTETVRLGYDVVGLGSSTEAVRLGYDVVGLGSSTEAVRLGYDVVRLGFGSDEIGCNATRIEIKSYLIFFGYISPIFIFSFTRFRFLIQDCPFRAGTTYFLLFIKVRFIFGANTIGISVNAFRRILGVCNFSSRTCFTLIKFSIVSGFFLGAVD